MLKKVEKKKKMKYNKLCHLVLDEKEEMCMRIRLKNIAKIIEADISMDGISIIAGNNNVGKSTILKTIYVAGNIFRNSNEKILNEQKRSLYSMIARFDDYFDSKGYDYLPTELLNDFANIICKNLHSVLESDNRFFIIKECFHESLSSYSGRLRDENIYSDDFLMPLYVKMDEVFNRSKEVLLRYIGDMYIKSTFNSQINFESEISLANIELFSSHGNNFIEIKNHKIEEISFNSSSEPDIIYLPTFNILDIVNRNNMWRDGLYSPAGDIRRYLRGVSVHERTYEEYSEVENNMEIVKNILDEVVNGNLRMSNGGVILYDDNDLGISVNMENVASGIKSFILIKKLVENGFLRKNGILLIDEPETNLHPEWHLKFAEILVLMNKYMGIMTVVNSHSPYFIRALEVMMADYGMKNKGHFYLMKEAKSNRYIAEDVTENTDCIYETLSKPLEYL